jgi:hypothetical protein
VKDRKNRRMKKKRGRKGRGREGDKKGRYMSRNTFKICARKRHKE